MKTVFAADHT